MTQAACFASRQSQEATLLIPHPIQSFALMESTAHSMQLFVMIAQRVLTVQTDSNTIVPLVNTVHLAQLHFKHVQLV